MSKIINERYKGKNLVTSFGILQFDMDGIAEVKEEFVGKLLELSGFSLAQEKEEVTQKIEPSNPEAEKKEEKPDLDKLTVPQLKTYAREHRIDLKDANKKVEIIPLLEG